jgi:RNA polymerase sigma-70 factor (ECF subfamily)
MKAQKRPENFNTEENFKFAKCETRRVSEIRNSKFAIRDIIPGHATGFRMTHGEDLTQLLMAWSDGDACALDKLIPLVHDELRRLAHRYMSGERTGHTLETTALVNEAYIRLIDSSRVRWQNRAHFFAVSAQLMRRILVDYARSHRSTKRGGGLQPVPLDETLALSPDRDPDLVALDEALVRLASLDERKSRVVELRFFGGLAVEETAEVLGVSADTVMRDWRLAKAWLMREMG